MSMLFAVLAALYSLVPGRYPVQIASVNTTVAVPIIGSAGIASAQTAMTWSSGLTLDSIRPNPRWFLITAPCGQRCLVWAGFDVENIAEQGIVAVAYFRTPNRVQCDRIDLVLQVMGTELGEDITISTSTRPLSLCTVRR